MAGIVRGDENPEVWRAAGVLGPRYEVSKNEAVRIALGAAARAGANAARRISGWARGRLGGGVGGGSDGGRGNSGGGGSRNDGGTGAQTEGRSSAGSGSGGGMGPRTEGKRSGNNDGVSGGTDGPAGADRTHVLGINAYQLGKDIASSSDSLKVLSEYAAEMRSGLQKLNAHLDTYQHSPEAARALIKLATDMSKQFERASLKTSSRSHIESLLAFTTDAEKVAKLPKRWIDIAYVLGIPPGVRFIYDRIFQNMKYSPEPIECPYTGLVTIVPAREHMLMSLEKGLSKMLELLPPRGSHAMEGLLSILPTNEALEESGLYVVPSVLRRFPVNVSSTVTNGELRFWLIRELDKVKVDSPEQAAFIDQQKALLKNYIGGEASQQEGERIVPKNI